MILKQTRLVTNDVAKLTRFYESVSQAKAEILSSGYAQFHNEPCDGLAIVEQASTEHTAGRRGSRGQSFGDPRFRSHRHRC